MGGGSWPLRRGFTWVVLALCSVYYLWSASDRISHQWPSLDKQTTGYDRSRKCFLTVPTDERGMICPHQKYMGFTNIVLNIAQCIHLARDVCNNGRAYIPLRVQHGTIDDLFNRSAWEVIGEKYNVDIQFYCDEKTIIAQRGILNGEAALKALGPKVTWYNVSQNASQTLCTNNPVFIANAFKTMYGPDPTVNDMILTMTRNLNSRVASWVSAIHNGLLKHNRKNNSYHGRWIKSQKNVKVNLTERYTVVHLRFEGDTWTLITFRAKAYDNPARLDQQVDRMNGGEVSNVTWYGSGSPLRNFGWGKRIHYKREFMDESKVVAPFLTEYWNSVAQPQQQTQQPIKKQSHNRQLQQHIIKELRTRPPTLVPFSSWYRDVQRVKNNKKNHHSNVSRPIKPPGPLWVNVTNSTGALIDFVMALYAHRSIVARFSSFGNQLAKMRCRFKLGETWIYTTNYKVRKAC
eukprot:PhF_6_TR31365/c1_g1_i3/m.45914